MNTTSKLQAQQPVFIRTVEDPQTLMDLTHIIAHIGQYLKGNGCPETRLQSTWREYVLYDLPDALARLPQTIDKVSKKAWKNLNFQTLCDGSRLDQLQAFFSGYESHQIRQKVMEAIAKSEEPNLDPLKQSLLDWEYLKDQPQETICAFKKACTSHSGSEAEYNRQIIFLNSIKDNKNFPRKSSMTQDVQALQKAAAYLEERSLADAALWKILFDKCGKVNDITVKEKIFTSFCKLSGRCQIPLSVWPDLFSLLPDSYKRLITQKKLQTSFLKSLKQEDPKKTEVVKKLLSSLNGLLNAKMTKKEKTNLAFHLLTFCEECKEDIPSKELIKKCQALILEEGVPPANVDFLIPYIKAIQDFFPTIGNNREKLSKFEAQQEGILKNAIQLQEKGFENVSFSNLSLLDLSCALMELSLIVRDASARMDYFKLSKLLKKYAEASFVSEFNEIAAALYIKSWDQAKAHFNKKTMEAFLEELPSLVAVASEAQIEAIEERLIDEELKIKTLGLTPLLAKAWIAILKRKTGYFSRDSLLAAYQSKIDILEQVPAENNDLLMNHLSPAFLNFEEPYTFLEDLLWKRMELQINKAENPESLDPNFGWFSFVNGRFECLKQKERSELDCTHYHWQTFHVLKRIVNTPWLPKAKAEQMMQNHLLVILELPHAIWRHSSSLKGDRSEELEFEWYQHCPKFFSYRFFAEGAFQVIETVVEDLEKVEDKEQRANILIALYDYVFTLVFKSSLPKDYPPGFPLIAKLIKLSTFLLEMENTAFSLVNIQGGVKEQEYQTFISSLKRVETINACMVYLKDEYLPHRPDEESSKALITATLKKFNTQLVSHLIQMPHLFTDLYDEHWLIYKNAFIGLISNFEHLADATLEEGKQAISSQKALFIIMYTKFTPQSPNYVLTPIAEPNPVAQGLFDMATMIIQEVNRVDCTWDPDKKIRFDCYLDIINTILESAFYLFMKEDIVEKTKEDKICHFKTMIVQLHKDILTHIPLTDETKVMLYDLLHFGTPKTTLHDEFTYLYIRMVEQFKDDPSYIYKYLIYSGLVDQIERNSKYLLFGFKRLLDDGFKYYEKRNEPVHQFIKMSRAIFNAEIFNLFIKHQREIYGLDRNAYYDMFKRLVDLAYQWALIDLSNTEFPLLNKMADCLFERKNKTVNADNCIPHFSIDPEKAFELFYHLAYKILALISDAPKSLKNNDILKTRVIIKGLKTIIELNNSLKENTSDEMIYSEDFMKAYKETLATLVEQLKELDNNMYQGMKEKNAFECLE